MNLPMMEQRSRNCVLLNKMGLAWALTKECEENALSECLQYMDDNEDKAYLQGMSEDMQKIIFRNISFLKYVLRFLKNGVKLGRVAALLEQVEIAGLMAFYEQTDVEAVLNDSTVSSKYIRVYLQHFYDKGFGEEDKKTLMEGMDSFYKNQVSLGEEWIAQYGMFLTEDVLSSDFLCRLTDYDKCLERYAESKEYRDVLSAVKSRMLRLVCLDDENAHELFEHRVEIWELLHEMEQYFDESQMDAFCKLWMENHALLYDLRHLKRKMEQAGGMDVDTFLTGRASYIAFCYNEYFPEPLEDHKEKLVIYAVTHKKHAFLKLIRDNFPLFQQISYSSILFRHTFYAKCINLNTLNVKNLKACAGMEYCQEKTMSVLAAGEHTFDEMALLYNLPVEYALLYEKISAARKDDKLSIMREIVKRKCISNGVALDGVAAQLSKKRLSDWMRQDFKHIRELDSEIAFCLLGVYDRIGCFVPQIKNVAEARYILNNLEKVTAFSSMQEIREDALNCNAEWDYLVEMFDFTEEFVEQNQERIKEFVFTDGVHITVLYLRNHTDKTEELRRLVTAELMGKFRELKYYGSDLQRELDFPVTENMKQNWMKNRSETSGVLNVWEEDGFIPVMKMGEMPYRTCLSYIDGAYSQCLIANHDSNKKVLYLSLNGKVVLRAALRLTKGTYRDTKNPDDTPQLQFADLTAEGNGQTETIQEQEEKEQLVLFLEREYISELPETMHKEAFNLMISLLRKKAAELRALLVISSDYRKYVSDEFISAYFSMYISKSKAGEQYLDSLGGSNRVNREGSYERNKFFIDNN
jgi:hypothetical protein